MRTITNLDWLHIQMKYLYMETSARKERLKKHLLDGHINDEIIYRNLELEIEEDYINRHSDLIKKAFNHEA